MTIQGFGQRCDRAGGLVGKLKEFRLHNETLIGVPC
jgi:hypothetical protein